MNEIVYMLVIWFIPLLILHELGYYVAYRYYNIKPKLKLGWWGVSIGEQKDCFKLTPYQLSIIAMSGIVSGFIYTIFFFNNYYTVIYVLMCGVDFYNLFFLMKFLKSKKNIGDIIIRNYKKEIIKLMKMKNGISKNN